ncbi:MAG: nucleotide exchange factor GrpE [Anaerolineaceae bacterium]|nr:nucleotide exchange factor GrpE [Anaerolineaceae bacterium]HOG77160.1 nucleotide exchange factor GrpE [Anaerolineaceae bacterium]
MTESKKHKKDEEIRPEAVSDQMGSFPAAAENGLETLQKAVDTLTAQSAEYLDSLQRERASFANYKKRVDQDNRLVYENALADIIKAFLPVVDDLERALKNKPADPDCEAWISGVALILQKLMKTLDVKGIAPLNVQPGDDFDPAFQEAVTHEDNPQYSNSQVIEVVQTGYKLKDRVIRPALVRVAK